MIDKEYKKILKQYHKLSDRHILVAETDMPYSDVLKVVNLSDKIRKAGNELIGLMRKNYDQLMRTKRYRKLLFLYGNTEDKDKRRIYANQLNEMQKAYHVTMASTSFCCNLSFTCIPKAVMPSLNCNLPTFTDIGLPRLICFARMQGSSPYFEK